MMEAMVSDEQKRLGNNIRDFIQSRVGDSGHAERLQMLATLRKQHFYWEGQQYLRPRYVGAFTVDWRPVSAQEMAARGAFAKVYNIYRGDGKKIISVLANRAPNVDVEPLVEEDEEGMQVAAACRRVVQALRRQWDCDTLQQEIAYLAWNSGTFFIRLDWRQQAEYGSSEVLTGMSMERRDIETAHCSECGFVADVPPGQPVEGISPCPQCGGKLQIIAETLDVPQPQFEMRMNGMPEPTVMDVSSVVVPQAAKDLDKSPFVIVEQEYHKGDLIALWPELGVSNPGTANLVGDFGVYTRLSLTGKLYYASTPDPNRWTLSEVWVRPSAYYSLSSKKEDGDALRQQYPQGLKATFVEGQLMQVEPGKASDWISFGKPSVSRGVYSESLGFDFLPGQDAYNNYMNVFEETAERNLPLTLVDAQLLSVDALRNRIGSSGEFIPVKPQGSRTLADAVYNVKGPSVEPAYSAWADQAHSIARENAGIQASLFGGETSHQITALEADNRLQQALAQLGLVWTGIRKCWKGAFENALRALARYGGQALLAEGCSEEDLQLIAGAFDEHGRLRRVRVEVQESIPATQAQIRSALQTALQAGPEMWGMLELTTADNAARVRESLGLRGFINKSERERDYLLGRVREILAGAAIPQLEAGEIVALDPMSVLSILSTWFLGPEGREAEKNNPQGHSAVVAWMLEWKQLTIPPSAAGGEVPGQDVGSPMGEPMPPQTGGVGSMEPAPLPQQ